MPHRRLRRKTTVGHVAVAIMTEAEAALGQPAPTAAVAPVPAPWLDAFLEEEDLQAEDAAKRKQVYLITLPHPRKSVQSAGDFAWRPPGDFNREQVVRMFIDICQRPAHVDAANGGGRSRAVTLERLVVFREMHKPDGNGHAHVHYHIALQLSSPASFAPLKRALKERHALASHWSCSHEGYWSTVRYGFFPSPKKPQAGAASKRGIEATAQTNID